MIVAKGILPHVGVTVEVKALSIRKMIDIEAVTKDDPTGRTLAKMAASVIKIDDKVVDSPAAFVDDLDMTDYTCLSELYDKANDIDKDSVSGFLEAVVLTA